jgi:hypothetical protein
MSQHRRLLLDGARGDSGHAGLSPKFSGSPAYTFRRSRRVFSCRRRGRTDLETISSPGSTPDEGLSEVIRHRTEVDHHLSTHKIAHSLRIAKSAVCDRLPNVLEMKCCHLLWIPHTLKVAQKGAREDVRKTVLEILASHTPQTFIFFFPGTNGGCYMPICLSHPTTSA